MLNVSFWSAAAIRTTRDGRVSWGLADSNIDDGEEREIWHNPIRENLMT